LGLGPVGPGGGALGLGSGFRDVNNLFGHGFLYPQHT
jgi:hypothetical protein